MNLVTKALALTTAGLFAASAQAATIIKVTVSGTIASGTDLTGTFGAVGANLAGAAYSLGLSYDLDDLTDNSFSVPGLATASVYDGMKVRSSAAVLTIGGATKTIVGSSQSSFARVIAQGALPYSTRVFYSISDNDTRNVIYIGANSQSMMFDNLNHTTDFSSSFSDSDITNSVIENEGNSAANLLLNIRRISSVSASVNAVPEPATWGMMIVGFGMIGGAVRHRRRSTAVAYA